MVRPAGTAVPARRSGTVSQRSSPPIGKLLVTLPSRTRICQYLPATKMNKKGFATPPALPVDSLLVLPWLAADRHRASLAQLARATHL